MIGLYAVIDATENIVNVELNPTERDQAIKEYLRKTFKNDCLSIMLSWEGSCVEAVITELEAVNAIGALVPRENLTSKW